MKNICNRVAFVLFAAVMFAATGCNPQRQAQKIRDGIRFEGIENIAATGLDSVVVTLKVRNDTGLRPVLSDGVIGVVYKGRTTATITLLQPVVLPPREVSNVAVAVRVEMNNPFEAYALWRQYQKKNFDDIKINVSLKGKISVKSFSIERQNIPLSTILSTFER